MKIHELAQMADMTVYAVRFYEKEGLLDAQHFVREANNYRNYSDKAVERLKFIQKFQGIGCTLAEIKTILQEKDQRQPSNLEIMDWIRHKITEVERKKEEYDSILKTLHWMLEYRMTLDRDPQRAQDMFESRHSGK